MSGFRSMTIGFLKMTVRNRTVVQLGSLDIPIGGIPQVSGGRRLRSDEPPAQFR